MEIRLKIEDSKASEIAVLYKLHETFKGSGLYLESFFSTEMVNHVVSNINNDLSCDVFNEFKYQVQEYDSAQSQVSMYEDDIQDLKADILNKQTVINSLQATLDKQKEQHDYISKANAELKGKFHATSLALEELKEGNMKLKARLFDYQEERKNNDA